MDTFFPVNNMTLPPEGPRIVPINADMSANLSVDIDLTTMTDNNYLSFVSGIWVDNLDNGEDFIILVNGTNQRIKVPANAQWFVPILATNPPKFNVSQAALGAVVKMFFVNFPVLPFLNNLNSAGVNEVKNVGPTIADKSLVLDGTNQTLFALGEAASYMAIQNPVGNADITVNLAGGDATAGGIVIVGGGDITLENGVANAVTVSGTNTQSVVAYGG